MKTTTLHEFERSHYLSPDVIRLADHIRDRRRRRRVRAAVRTVTVEAVAVLLLVVGLFGTFCGLYVLAIAVGALIRAASGGVR